MKNMTVWNVFNPRYVSLIVISGLFIGLSGCGGDSGGETTEKTQSYSVQTSVGEGGIVSPTSQTVVSGSSISFTVTANTGYSIKSVTGCGGTLANNTYTTGRITTDCTVTASFSLNSYNITATADIGGSITPTNTTVSYGETASFTLSTDDGYEIAEVSGTCAGALNDNVFTTNEIVADCSILASFNLLPPSAPSLTLTPQSVKTFAFSWADVSGETEYRLLENADGQSGFSEVAVLAANTTEHSIGVFLPARINASYKISACNSAGCSDSDTVGVSGTLAEAVGYVKASNTDSRDEFGWSIALSSDGGTVAVGAPHENSSSTGVNGDETDNDAQWSGSVYVFTRNGANWSQQAYLKASNTDAYSRFGDSVALSGDGNTLAVGASSEGSNNSGAVYIFSRDGLSWSQQVYIKASNTDANDRFGGSVALSGDGDILAVGAPGEDSNTTGINGVQTDNSATDSGAVYVYRRDGLSWSQQAYIKASNTDANDRFGGSVALSGDGDTLAVGASDEDSSTRGINGDETDNSATGSGAVYVYNSNGLNWSQQAYIKASNTGAGDAFGSSVTLAANGSKLAAGAPDEDSNAIGINGDETNNLAEGSGAVYVFSRTGENWSQQTYIKASNTGSHDKFGFCVAFSGDGNTLATGSHLEGGDATGINGDQDSNLAYASGAAYLFSRSNDSWSQKAYIKASNPDAHDYFGLNVSLSSDATTLAIGAIGEASSATGINGDETDNSAEFGGAVYIY